MDQEREREREGGGGRERGERRRERERERERERDESDVTALRVWRLLGTAIGIHFTSVDVSGVMGMHPIYAECGAGNFGPVSP